MLQGIRGEGRGARDAGAGDTLAASLATRVSGATRSWRQSWIAIAAVAATLLIAIGTFALWPRRPVFTYDRLPTLSGQWFAQLRASAGWQPLPPHEIVRDYPPPDAIRVHPNRWADVSELVGTPACAYEMTTSDRRRAILFVIYQPTAIAGSTPPLEPASSSGMTMLTIGCWQSGDRLYVLAVEGTERSYRSLLNETGPPLAFNRASDPSVLVSPLPLRERGRG
jgi:hypothetical protein